MNISDIFKGEHAMIDEEQLIQLSGLTEKKLRKFNLSQQSLEEVSKILDVDKKFLFLDPNGVLNPFCYWDKFFYFRFLSLDMDYLNMKIGMDFTISKQFQVTKEKLYSYKKEKLWEECIFLSDKKVSMLVFMNLRNLIPKEQQKEIFLNEYQRNEYGFDRLNPNIVREVLKLPTPKEYNIDNYKGKPNEHGYYTVYRGVTPQSSPLDKAYSWTLDRSVARFFAERFNSKGKILKGKVHKNNIHAYIENEKEVLIFAEDIILLD